MAKLKLLGICIFGLPAIIYFLLWIILFVSSFKRQESLFLELVDLYNRVLAQGLPLERARDKELFNNAMDFAIHSSMLTWIGLIVFSI
jgi:hypothetical protein